MKNDSFIEEIFDDEDDAQCGKKQTAQECSFSTTNATTSATTSATASSAANAATSATTSTTAFNSANATTSATASAVNFTTSATSKSLSLVAASGDELDEFDAASQATRWSAGAKRDKTVPYPGKSMNEARESGACLHDAANNYVNHIKGENGTSEAEFKKQIDARTGATPGVASACKDLDMDTVDKVSKRLGIKMPGES